MIDLIYATKKKLHLILIFFKKEIQNQFVFYSNALIIFIKLALIENINICFNVSKV
jgi:hypothetical protein